MPGASPPKPWERAGTAAALSSTAAPPAVPTMASATSALSESVPSLPSRPSTLTPSIATTPATTNALNPYAQPYNRFGTYSSPYSTYGGYSGYGGYGSTYGGYGGMYGGMGYGMPGMIGMDPNNPSLAQQLGSSTSQTFALIQSIVQTFGGFAQMLDSTFMATQSSFFAMLGVADQFSQLRGALSQVFGVFGLVAWLRGWWKGEKPSMSEEFKRFLSTPQPQRGGTPGTPSPKPSRKPLLVFLLAVFGLPYLMHRLVKMLSRRLPSPEQLAAQQVPIDPSKLSFARAVYPFTTQDPVELGLAKGEIVAILSTRRVVERTNKRWREGWFPRDFVEIIKQKEASPLPAPLPTSAPTPDAALLAPKIV
ncbi:Peroxin 13, N-terminal region-domain-containing protein [Cantharellus anzutake]|uniref:Peroxin 13, N-terminal region-domain-containing protein n=1 Tax=Cantharellus anzutake TaxID=1750568 RepID=UPI00190837F6|nr:Peroxin 13, N-terminal region-domain-containing protein [Cantharellus anzutake]KAF8330775.1 Peroxin 13, N-terminal region-domain-containing protein [Cantharellus anzutake]